MAGIAGYLGRTEDSRIIRSMARKLSHRGAGEVFYQQEPVFVGLRTPDGDRDLSFICRDSGIVVFVDGHIGNAAALRARGISEAVTQSTTTAELILRLYQAKGVSFVRALEGSFVICLHDPEANMVLLARDHLGVKPLYHTTTPSGTFVFASEIKALLDHPGVRVEPDLMTMDAFLSLGFCPGPQTLFKGIHALPAGHRLMWNPGLHVDIESYWDLDQALIGMDPAIKTDRDIQTHFNILFENAVKQSTASLQGSVGVVLNADVASLAAVTALQRAGAGAGGQVPSFSASFRGDETNSTMVRALSDRLGTHHHDIVINPDDMNVLPEIVWSLDQPVADPDVVLRYHLCRLANRQVSGLLAEEGADDLMAGHALHKNLLEAYRKPKAFYSLMKPLVRFAPLAGLNKVYGELTALGPGRVGEASRRRLLDFMDAMSKGDVASQYMALSVVFGRREKAAMYGRSLSPYIETYNDNQRRQQGIYPSFLAALQGLQRRQGLSESVLTGFDKLSALAGIDARLPFADRELAEFMQAVPDHLKVGGGRSKILLQGYVSAGRSASSVMSLPGMLKAAPVFPFAAFTTSPAMRDMLNATLSEESVRRRGLFDGGTVKALIGTAKQGDALACRQVFALLTLELWFRIYLDNEKGWVSAA